MMRHMQEHGISFAQALGHGAADKRIAVLREIARGGSISQAARSVGVSYKAAWQAIDTLTNLAGTVLVERVVGGAGGGGARLTAAGHELLAAADAMQQVRAQVVAQVAGGGQAHAAAAHLAVRTSMRNQWPCTVQLLERQGTIVRVQLRARTTSDAVLNVHARITRESAQLLGLERGMEVLVLCKATAVHVAPRAPDGEPARENHWSGRVQRVARGPQGDEVAVLLDGGLQLVGFAPAHSALRVRAPVVARADASALAIMVQTP